MDRDIEGRKDEALGEVFVPIASFKEAKVSQKKNRTYAYKTPGCFFLSCLAVHLGV